MLQSDVVFVKAMGTMIYREIFSPAGTVAPGGSCRVCDIGQADPTSAYAWHF